ncbi:hypothetical protein MGYG_07332 [Nannizzia gypsea CBS 118893]|uniref:Uncharacterized protein n=1 Tax=Arthroderma gypseum (strain ATCC MYA-4604 / CBS 118893) TaxID=535722 RepID=E4V2V1_ARTGP|nr:hypothetical protein MGYG_07332 [Nannizzia gypsea CBS 118893]EFR04325.1 hypothetical protein MGYG_07332 [Nannizzia gypsea CBS 118893]
MEMMLVLVKPRPSHLLLLGAVGIISIWGFIGYWGGMFDNFDAIVASGSLPDGRPMRMDYTRVKYIDSQLAPVIAFYEVLSNKLSLGPRLLFLDINFVVACTNIWVLVESRRRGARNLVLKWPGIFIFLWNCIGAALILPHYLYCLLQSKATRRDAAIPKHEAISLFITTFAMISFPLLLFAPVLLDYSSKDHHGFIALFHATPFLATLFFSAIAGIIQRLTPSDTGDGLNPSKQKQNHNVDEPWIVSSFVLVGTAAAIVHVLTMVVALRANSSDATIQRLFVPSFSSLRKANTLPSAWTSSYRGIVTGKASHAGTGLPAKYEEILEQFHLFTQFDWIVISLSCIVFSYLLLPDASASGTDTPREEKALLYLTLGSLLIGPGAAGSFALALRESKLREQVGSSIKAD